MRASKNTQNHTQMSNRCSRRVPNHTARIFFSSSLLFCCARSVSSFPLLFVHGSSGINNNSNNHNKNPVLSKAKSSPSSTSCAATTKTTAMTMSAITGMEPGPFPIGVTTVQIDDPARADPSDPSKPRSLQTEIWYPATDEAKTMPKNRYSEYVLGGRTFSDEGKKAIFEVANGGNAIGGYRDGLSIEELDDPEVSTWQNDAVRNAPIRDYGGGASGWPLVVFSHGWGAYRCSYLYWTEFLASHGFVVAACDHPGNARFTLIDGKPIVPDELERSSPETVVRERPPDVLAVIDGIEKLSAGGGSGAAPASAIDFAGRIDCGNIAVSGMSIGGDTITKVLEHNDPRIKAAVLKCPSIGRYELDGGAGLHVKRSNKHTPVMVMIGTEDTVIGPGGNANGRSYFEGHDGAAGAYLVEIVRGGHVSFTSCEMYDPDYGNGIASKGNTCPSGTNPGTTYEPLDIVKQHTIINSYGLAFLNTHLRKEGKNNETTTGLGASIGTYNESYLQKNQFAGMDGEVLYRKRNT